MTDYISFPPNGKVSRKKKEFCIFVINSQQNSGNAKLKKILCLMHYQKLDQKCLFIWKVNHHKKKHCS